RQLSTVVDNNDVIRLEIYLQHADNDIIQKFPFAITPFSPFSPRVPPSFRSEAREARASVAEEPQPVAVDDKRRQLSTVVDSCRQLPIVVDNNDVMR
ncbi:MAG: hypothetical protein LBH84_07280, partial [Prevotellaceae bacterium]|nr:hypothetical protein [Prevotellaceae bacterium]